MARIGLYQPFIEDRNVRRLYRLKVEFRERAGRRVPMTTLVNRILDDFFDGPTDTDLLGAGPEPRAVLHPRQLPRPEREERSP